MSTPVNVRLATTKAVLWLLVGVATAVAAVRYAYGLGLTTALTDLTPWGLWIGLDVMAGVALAAGGFVIAATVYVFHLERYHALVRPAVLTAFLGYVAVVLGLLVDLGRPWNIWRMTVHWQPTSALFEVGWCVMLYLTVLTLEFAPVVFEGLRWNRAFALLKRATLPLVIVGIALSTLHQSSLGTLLVIAPERLHPLWYSPILPLLFLVSAIGLGLATVVVEDVTSTWLYRRAAGVGPPAGPDARLGSGASALPRAPRRRPGFPRDAGTCPGGLVVVGALRRRAAGERGRPRPDLPPPLDAQEPPRPLRGRLPRHFGIRPQPGHGGGDRPARPHPGLLRPGGHGARHQPRDHRGDGAGLHVLRGAPRSVGDAARRRPTTSGRP